MGSRTAGRAAATTFGELALTTSPTRGSSEATRSQSARCSGWSSNGSASSSSCVALVPPTPALRVVCSGATGRAGGPVAHCDVRVDSDRRAAFRHLATRSLTVFVVLGSMAFSLGFVLARAGASCTFGPAHVVWSWREFSYLCVTETNAHAMGPGGFGLALLLAIAVGAAVLWRLGRGNRRAPG